ncbi:MAG: threonylcarbamoyl-AMP synthase [Bacteroidia bacterium]|nr:threonylcarbamoyl-AMP synthase [Bacteroidota bacterium]MBP9083425.1 threonylcarbamoyl-AMP synthase [Bacteroidia bacterium]MBK7970801.1 threonylcarbamoyl-AMP synthase [Bacteroidota bacterium]MBK8873102.1 threonylcarbamoyl-AMP synthase [Bacteroidota bacterium]MBK9048839.1 threonylcarbamoyl-AMP synthase [Bacteroidota bacterium]
MLLEIHPDNPNSRHISQVVDVLRKGGVIIFPTDTIYGIGCDVTNQKAFEKLCRIRGVKPQKANFSFLLNDLAHISEYTRPFDREVFKLLKATLPGPFTYILPASNMVPALFRNNRKTIGIRVPDNKIIRTLVAELGNPIVSASLRDDLDTIAEYLTDPKDIEERFGNQVDLVIDGGYGQNTASTVIDCTGDAPVVIREGLGQIP